MRYKHYMALRWAVARAAEWRGELMGDPDPEPLAAFDKQIAICKEALKEIPKDTSTRWGVKLAQGFTLIELMVVLVIVGLMLEMVLAGNSAIHAARVHDIVAQQSGLRAAFQGFQDRYRALPGDYAGAVAALGVPAGDGNGRIDAGEAALAWVQLAAAGYISTPTPENVYGQPVTVAFGAAYGDGHAAPHHNITTGAGVPASVLHAVDLKIDDGLPYSGDFQTAGSPLCADTPNRVWAAAASDCAATTVLK